MTGDPELYRFYEGYFTGPHFPPRPWPEVARLEANARLVVANATTREERDG